MKYVDCQTVNFGCMYSYTGSHEEFCCDEQDLEADLC